MTEPFLTFYTPTYRRPAQLARCLESVRRQTAIDRIEQLVIVDHVGVGVDGMYARVPQYAPAVHGQYVYLLADDDVLHGDTVVASLESFARACGFPEVILVQVEKGGLFLPLPPIWPPVCGRIDLGNLVVRRDVWLAHLDRYGRRYEGDYDFAASLADYKAHYMPMLFALGAVSRGAPEVAA